ncbi:MAG: polymerase [Bacillota bacterium]|nr:polymerase [Bacillota bacterium]
MAETILHVDMNAFFAACHQAADPGLRGRPLLVSGDPEARHGIILTASYEARPFGVKTAMPTGEALRLCPQATVVRPDFKLYSSYSRRVMAILSSYTPLVEQFSIDEAWLDVAGCESLFGPPMAVAREIKARIKAELGLTCSIGIAPTKILAKMASDLEKPDGLVLISMADVPARIWPLPVEALFGVGPQTAAALRKLGIRTIGQLARYPRASLKARFGVYGEYLAELAQGRDGSRVQPEGEGVKSVGNSITLPHDTADPEEIETVLLALAEEVGTRLRRRALAGRTVTVSVKTPEFKLHTRSATYPDATALTEAIYARAQEVFRRHFVGRTVRLVGLSMGNLVPPDAPAQLDLFTIPETEKRARLAQTVDRLRARFGEDALVRARLLKGPRLSKK